MIPVLGMLDDLLAEHCAVAAGRRLAPSWIGAVAVVTLWRALGSVVAWIIWRWIAAG